jgi:hypothetical protein
MVVGYYVDQHSAVQAAAGGILPYRVFAAATTVAAQAKGDAIGRLAAHQGRPPSGPRTLLIR